MIEVFNNCSSLISLPNIYKWNTSKVKYIKRIIKENLSLTNFDEFDEWIENIKNKNEID